MADSATEGLLYVEGIRDARRNHDMLQLAARLGFTGISRGGNEVVVVRQL